jgi:hypothetical protein
MNSVLFTPFAEFFDLDFSLNFALVLSRPVIGSLAFGALKLY